MDFPGPTMPCPRVDGRCAGEHLASRPCTSMRSDMCTNMFRIRIRYAGLDRNGGLLDLLETQSFSAVIMDSPLPAMTSTTLTISACADGGSNQSATDASNTVAVEASGTSAPENRAPMACTFLRLARASCHWCSGQMARHPPEATPKARAS